MVVGMGHWGKPSSLECSRVERSCVFNWFCGRKKSVAGFAVS